jgi:hypothetical protein
MGLASMLGQGKMVASSKRGEETLRVRSSQEEGFRLEADNCWWKAVRRYKVMSQIRIKLTDAQLLALDTAGAFEEPLDERDEVLAAAIQLDYLVTDEPKKLACIILELSNEADDRAENRNYDFNHLDAGDRRMYRTDRDVFSRLARKLDRRAQVQL